MTHRDPPGQHPEDPWRLSNGDIVRVLYHVIAYGRPHGTYSLAEAMALHRVFPEHKIRATMVKVS